MVLPRLLRNELAGRRGVFYLDAHWGTDLPLRHELTEIFSSNRDAVVMIDDFRVPDDDGYHYDDYGTAGQLTVEYLTPILDTFRLRVFYPTLASRDETGAKRGCVVLAASDDVARALCSSKLLRIHASPKECNVMGPNHFIE